MTTAKPIHVLRKLYCKWPIRAIFLHCNYSVGAVPGHSVVVYVELFLHCVKLYLEAQSTGLWPIHTREKDDNEMQLQEKHIPQVIGLHNV